jgi:hypothetical protein
LWILTAEEVAAVVAVAAAKDNIYINELVMYWIRYILFLVACFCTFEIGAQTASCGWSDPVVRFAGGDKACFREFPLLTKKGVISTDQNLSYLSIAERYGNNYAIAITANPKLCPFETYSSWKQGGREAVEALKSCQEKLRSTLGSTRPESACSCEILIDSGESTLTRSKFKEKTELYERQLEMGKGPLEKYQNQVVIAPEPAVVATASNNGSQTDVILQEQERQRLLREIKDKEIAEPAIKEEVLAPPRSIFLFRRRCVFFC